MEFSHGERLSVCLCHGKTSVAIALTYSYTPKLLLALMIFWEWSESVRDEWTALLSSWLDVLCWHAPAHWAHYWVTTHHIFSCQLSRLPRKPFVGEWRNKEPWKETDDSLWVGAVSAPAFRFWAEPPPGACCCSQAFHMQMPSSQPFLPPNCKVSQTEPREICCYYFSEPKYFYTASDISWTVSRMLEIINAPLVYDQNMNILPTSERRGWGVGEGEM